MVHFFGKFQNCIFNQKADFVVLLFNTLIQDRSDHGASKEAKNPLLVKDSLVPVIHCYLSDFLDLSV